MWGGGKSALNKTKQKKPVTAVQSGVCGDCVEKMSLRRREGKNKETVIDISGLRGGSGGYYILLNITSQRMNSNLLPSLGKRELNYM